MIRKKGLADFLPAVVTGAFLVVAGGSLWIGVRNSSSVPFKADRLEVKISEQKLYAMAGERVLKIYSVSTSKFGIGSAAGSNKTPLGAHKIARMIGDKEPIYTIFRDRKRAGVLKEPNMGDTTIGDTITSRILWLEGMEPGRNKGKGMDSYARFIYIHGTADEGLIGRPASHGCVRMRNADVIELFGRVETGTLVNIS